MAKENISLNFRLRKIDETTNYFLEEIEKKKIESAEIELEVYWGFWGLPGGSWAQPQKPTHSELFAA